MSFLTQLTERVKSSANRRRMRRLFDFLVDEGVDILSSGQRFAVPIDMLGSQEAISQFTNTLSRKLSICVRASVARGLCFVYADGDDDVGTEITIIGVKR